MLLIVWALGGLPRRTAYAQPPKTILISDIDDTIKLTRLIHRGNYGDALENIFNAHGAFVGMADIYSRLHENGVEIIYVSGAIRLISRLPNDFIEDSKFPSGQVFLRVSPFTSIEDFKVKTIQGILQQNRGARVVLIGENGERDCASYERIREDPQVGSMVQRIYIHKLYEGPPSMVPPVDQRIFITAGELAVGLHTDGLLTVDQLRDVLVTVGDGLDSHDPKTRNRTLPAFAEISKGDVEQAFGHSESPRDDISEQVAKIRSRVLAQVKP